VAAIAVPAFADTPSASAVDWNNPGGPPPWQHPGPDGHGPWHGGPGGPGGGPGPWHHGPGQWPGGPGGPGPWMPPTGSAG
jgi:hypothetical protein